MHRVTKGALKGALAPVVIILLIVALVGGLNGIRAFGEEVRGLEGAWVAVLFFVILGGWAILIVLAIIGAIVGDE